MSQKLNSELDEDKFILNHFTMKIQRSHSRRYNKERERERDLEKRKVQII